MYYKGDIFMFLTHFLKGIECFFTGVSRFYSDKSLLKYAAIPFLLMLGAYFIYLISAVLLAGFIASKTEAYLADLPSYLSWAAKILSGGAAVSVLLLAFVLATLAVSSLYEIFAGPFFDSLIVCYEKKYLNLEHPQISFLRMLRLQIGSIRYSINTLLLSLILCLPAALLPFAGTVLMTLIMGYRIGATFCIPQGLLQNQTVREQLAQYKGKRAAVLGFGIIIYLHFLLPLAPLFLLPGVILGGSEIRQFISHSAQEK